MREGDKSFIEDEIVVLDKKIEEIERKLRKYSEILYKGTAFEGFEEV
jgi:hypothetical protein